MLDCLGVYQCHGVYQVRCTWQSLACTVPDTLSTGQLRLEMHLFWIVDIDTIVSGGPLPNLAQPMYVHACWHAHLLSHDRIIS